MKEAILKAIYDNCFFDYETVADVYDIVGSYDQTITTLSQAWTFNLNPVELARVGKALIEHSPVK